MKRVITHTRSLLGVTAGIISGAGGALPLTRRLVQIVMREGVPGVRRRMLFLVRFGRVGLARGSGPYLRNDYQNWRRFYAIPDESEQGAMRTAVAAMATRPVFSIIMPVYNPPLRYLSEAIDSVKAQIYPHWQLCIADDGSSDEGVRSLLREMADGDDRIDVVFREETGHISAASNSALELARGDWAVLMDNDDLLPCHALYCVADAINRHPDAAIVYSDEDRFDDRGRFFSPYFKTDWNRSLFYSQNMISHLGAYDLALIRQVGGFAKGMEGSQDYDLALRCVEQIDDHQIIHVPRVLYHWRVHRNSTSRSNTAKPYAVTAAEKALSRHFHTTGYALAAVSNGVGYEAEFPPADMAPVGLVVLDLGGAGELEAETGRALASLASQVAAIHWVGSNPSAGTAAALPGLQIDADPDVVPALHALLAQTDCRQLFLFDARLHQLGIPAIERLLTLAQRPGVGIAGGAVINEQRRLVHTGFALTNDDDYGLLPLNAGLLVPHPGYFGRGRLISQVSAADLCFAAVDVDALRPVQLDSALSAPELQMIDWCLQVGARGLQVVIDPQAEGIRAGVDWKQYGRRDAQALRPLRARWPGVFNRDPLYSPNLTCEAVDWTLAWPPRLKRLDGQAHVPIQQ